MDTWTPLLIQWFVFIFIPTSGNSVQTVGKPVQVTDHLMKLIRRMQRLRKSKGAFLENLKYKKYVLSYFTMFCLLHNSIFDSLNVFIVVLHCRKVILTKHKL
ncbi:hypothetical protein ILYODFUR_034679 [Ilyodon furcidens]|uniref:Uncharacterized protein n=1 Tax=Ilyodon furcidens TaxID=33524 RepID=A0ABV0TG31_9TELE